MSVYEDLRRAVYDVLGPDLREIKDGLRGISSRLDDLNRHVERLELRRRIENLERHGEEEEKVAQ